MLPQCVLHNLDLVSVMHLCEEVDVRGESVQWMG